MTEKWYRMSCFLVLLVALMLRLVFFSTQPLGLYWDEVAVAIDAKTIAETGSDMHGSSWFQPLFFSYGDFKSPIFIWLAALAYRITTIPEVYVRLPNLIVGVTLVLVLAEFIKKTYLVFVEPKNQNQARLLGLIAAILTATSPWAIHFSRVGFESFIAQFWLVLSIFMVLFFNPNNKKTYIWFCCSILFGILATYTYYAARFIWPVIFFTSVLALPVQNSARKIQAWMAILLIIGLGSFFIAIRFIQVSPWYQASQVVRLSTDSVLAEEPFVLESNKLREQVGSTTIDRLLFHRNYLQAKALTKNIFSHLSIPFLFFNGDSNLRHGVGTMGLFLLPSLLFLLAGLYWVARLSTRLLVLLLIWWLVALVPAAIPLEVPHALRSLPALAPIVTFMAYGGVASWLWSKNQFLNHYRLILSILSLLYFACLVQFLHYYWFEYPQLSRTHWQDGYKQLAQKIHKLAPKYPQVYVDPPESRFYLWLLLYSSYTGNDIVSFGKNGGFESFSNFSFSIPNTNTVNSQPVLVVMPKSKISMLHNTGVELEFLPESGYTILELYNEKDPLY